MKPNHRGPSKNPTLHLDAQLKVRRGMFSHEWVKVQVFKFSADGMTVRTDEDLPAGSRATFSILLAMDFGDIRIDKIEARVNGREKVCSCFDYTLDFVLGSNAVRREAIQSSLQKIESLLSSYDSLLNKIRSGPLSGSI
ncbi:hypothetical protein BTA51_26995 [Hahella sp. CCB-MM4]|uniref:hypothetical protein n=1 Tax=Hahella sp. (strain CCB-MM4) TaxID=1926491 RepID=UPI000BD8E643|nr:hypothetical protein [Hahella sp. CCB-MM4]OZG70250.1 hypothetical protein BTA51_26995 [Hahella sp. CCB-MM4]